MWNIQKQAEKPAIDINKEAQKVVNKKKYLTPLEQEKIKDLNKDVETLGEIHKKIGELVVTGFLHLQQSIALNTEIGKKHQTLQTDLSNTYGKYSIGENFEVITED